MDCAKVVGLLRQDMAGEHQAIVQYLNHAYTMGREDLAPAIESVAREEMRHLDWLADAITELGGDPSVEREPVDFVRDGPAAQMAKNVGLEDTAIEQYRAHIEAIDDDKIRLLLSRILHDERAHRLIFTGLVEKAGAGEAEANPGEPRVPPPRLAAILNEGVRHEYTVVLQYLYHSFVAEDKELAEGLQNAAINEMQHMGWLSEEVAEQGGQPDMSHLPLALSRDAEQNLEADIAVEREVTRAYTSQIPEIEEASVRALVERIRDHEIYHAEQFGNMLTEIEGARAGEPSDEETCSDADAPPAIPSVGSLLDGC